MSDRNSRKDDKDTCDNEHDDDITSKTNTSEDDNGDFSSDDSSSDNDVKPKANNKKSDGITFARAKKSSQHVIVVHPGQLEDLLQCSKTGNMLSCPVCVHYQDYILLSQLTWTNCSNHLQNPKKYIENARRKETDILEKRKRAIAQLNWL